MVKKKKILLLVILICGLGFFQYYNDIDKENNTIDKILESSSYSYLSSNAKDYIRNYYNATGKVLLTEKNNKSNEEYLNPDYIEYMDGGAVGNTGYVPDVLTYDYKFDSSSIDIENLPRKYDSRNENGKSYVTPTKRQFGELCWDYAFTSTIESKLLKEGVETDALNLNLSERMIDYATSDPTSIIDIEKNPYYGDYSLNSLANSGNELRYSSALVNGLFPIAESDWLYENEYLGKVKPEDIYDFSKIKYQVNEIKYLKDNNYDVGFDENTNKLLKQLIMENGAIVLALRVGSGNNYIIYQAKSEEPLNAEYNYNYLYYKASNAMYQSNDHMTSIIGWNDDYIHNVCVLDDGSLEDSIYNNGSYSCENGILKTLNGAWIIKDSGTSSYHYVAYETVNSEYYAVTNISYRDWDNVYSLSNEDGYIKEESNTYIFKKLENSEKLKSIKLYSSSAISDMDIYINTYDGTGEKRLTTFTSEVAGMYTIPIDQNIVLSNDKFSIRLSKSDFVNIGGNLSVFTSNIDNDLQINIDDAEIVNSFNYQSLLDEYQNVIVLKGRSRNVKDNINYVIKNNRGVDVTDSFNITRNYTVGNYVNSLIRFNNSIPFGEYTIYAYIDNSMYTTFKMNIDKYMEKVSGDGSEDNPYIITNPVQLDMIRLNKYSYYKLGNDIDLTYDTQNENGLFYNDGLGWDPISYSDCWSYINEFNTGAYCDEGFSGSLDGDNHQITGLFINRPDEDLVGLFRSTYNNNYSSLNIRNIILKDVNITGNNFVGGLLGYAFGVNYERTLILENLSVSGHVQGNDYIGGLIGYFLGGTGLPNYLVENTSCTSRHCLNNLFNSSDVQGNNYVGGIVGLLETQNYYNFNNSLWHSTIDANNWQNNGVITSINDAAGFAGYILINNGNTITINNAINTGIVKSKANIGIVNEAECKNEDNTYPNCSLTLKNIYYVNDKGYKENNIISVNNVKKYDIINLTQDNIYNSFTDFSTFYKKETINGIKRIPFLKNADIEYTEVPDILINGKKDVNLYDYIDGSDNIVYSIDDDNIASIDEFGIISPKKSGTTNIHITSYYDGYDKNIMLTVNLSNEVYTITYNLNGGEVSNPTSYTANSDTFTLSNPTKEGYIFDGWTGSNGNIPQKSITIAKGTTGNLTYTANWAPLQYYVSFDCAGGSSIDSIIVNYNNLVTKPQNPVKDGYVFKYWSYNGNIFDFNTPITTNTTLVAVWEQQELSLSEILHNNNYIIENNYVLGFNLGDSIASIKNKLNDDNIIINTVTSIISTGTVISKNNDSYTVVIKGDTDGDGKINYLDYVKVYNHIKKTKHPESNKKLLVNEYLNAADMSNDNIINYLDYVKIYNKIKELKLSTN